MGNADEKRLKQPSQRLARISARTGKPLQDDLPAVAVPKKKSERSESVFNAAERAAEFYDHLRAHYRKAKRVPVAIDADLKILLADGTVVDSGSAVVMNVSPSGALLGKVKLGKNSYPVRPFKIELVMKGGDYEGIGIEARPIRFEHEHEGIGVRFVEIFVAV
ncbi:MAG TPA: hypothetical protein VEK08_14680 [Planctomycetota bacterium]|nr:hypothetical protein [Planctomycetota bacterium]